VRSIPGHFSPLSPLERKTTLQYPQIGIVYTVFFFHLYTLLNLKFTQMANPHKYYLQHMNDKTGYRSTWAPDKVLEIGQIGQLDRTGIFNVYTTLQKEGIPVEVSNDVSDTEMDYTSNDSVDVSIKLSGAIPAAGSVLANADAGFQFTFKKENSVVFKTSGHKTHQIVNLAAITKKVLEKYKNDEWEKDWLIITELVVADTSTIIIGNSKNAGLELKANANVTAGQLKLTDASLGLTVAHEQGSTLKYITQNGLTPLYRVMGIRDPWIGKTRVETKGERGAELLADGDFTIRGFDPREFGEEED
jgi:soluble P-type ATPase